MEAVCSIQTVTSDFLMITGMRKYFGQQVEIIILPLEQPEKKLEKPKESIDVTRVRGYLHQYANPALIEQEKDAWKLAMKEKHAIR
ncbi:hypothetical protein U27_03980 [Candidatus Vecturithrix granuli]|uniref:Uncharacterized protein n=1 Tax=Vecturithrix granuli TaxID=1499967 RepID=A0A081BXG1_VECG1|nr:hypothetical protein U27_03980 [Candidatus Vecturithrix granuli]